MSTAYSPGARALSDARRAHFGFLDPRALAVVLADPACRLEQLLIRAHEGRLVCPAQDAAAIIAALSSAGWTIRDVSAAVAGASTSTLDEDRLHQCRLPQPASEPAPVDTIEDWNLTPEQYDARHGGC